jgi:hypothetical protein
MTVAAQNIDSAYGLNKVARDAAIAAGNASAAAQLTLDPSYPWYVLAFDPGFYGTPQALTSQDFEDYS